MTKIIEDKLEKIPIIRPLMHFTQKIKLPWLEGLSFYDLLELYFIGIAKVLSLIGRVRLLLAFYGTFSVCAVYFELDSVYSY